jgi:excisionase family DNA binding protein
MPVPHHGATTRKAPRRPGTVAQGARQWGISERTVWRYIAEGRIQAWRIGPKLLRIDLDQIAELGEPVTTLDPPAALRRATA